MALPNDQCPLLRVYKRKLYIVQFFLWCFAANIDRKPKNKRQHILMSSQLGNTFGLCLLIYWFWGLHHIWFLICISLDTTGPVPPLNRIQCTISFSHITSGANNFHQVPHSVCHPFARVQVSNYLRPSSPIWGLHFQMVHGALPGSLAKAAPWMVK